MKDDLLLLTYLKSILAGGSLTKGAENIFVSQPYLSKYISDAERELGFVLLDRSKRPVTLSKQGVKFIQGIEHLNFSYEKLINNVSEMNTDSKNKLILGINQSMSSIMLPQLLCSYSQQFPDKKISIIEGQSKGLENKLLSKKIDMHIRLLPIFPAEISYKLLAELPIYLIVNKSSKIFEKGNTKIRTLDIQNEYLLNSQFISIKSGSGFMRLVELFLSQKGLRLKSEYEVKYIETAANLAYQGLGCAFVPKFYVNSDFNPSLCNVIRIPEQQVSLKIILSYLDKNISEHDIEGFIDGTNIKRLVSSMNIHQYN